MIDPGAIHNFLCERLCHEAQLTVGALGMHNVIFRDELTVNCSGICRDDPIEIKGLTPFSQQP